MRNIRQAPNSTKTFYVTGDSGKEYMVCEKRDPIQHRPRWMCTCMDFIIRRFEVGENCKHIDLVLAHIRCKLTLLQEQDYITFLRRHGYRRCQFCDSSVLIMEISSYRCRNCDQRWEELLTITGIRAINN